MLALFLWLCSLLTGPEIHRLGSPEFTQREEAQERLRSLGVLAIPGILNALAGEDAEVRFRAAELLGPWRRTWLLARAAGALGCADPPDPWQFERDYQLREATYDLAVRLGVGRTATPWPYLSPILPVNQLRPENDDWSWWACEHPAIAVARALDVIRRELDTPPPLAPRPRAKP